MRPNLLVVDFDFFFPNPLQGYGYKTHAAPLLYDWGHKEVPFNIYNEVLWAGRAQGFMQYGFDLPRCEGWKRFWRRFVFAPGAPLFYADSNMWAGDLVPGKAGLDAEAWNMVSLWDAHHDCGYQGTHDEWLERDEYNCENWMLVHDLRGSDLEVIYPTWRMEVGTVEPEPLINVERRVDDRSNPTRTYDAVFLCRSGAWVPPWCDDQFSDFLADYKAGPAQEYPGNEWIHPRPDVTASARQMVEAQAMLRAELDKEQETL